MKRLGQIARELNVGISTLIHFLNSKGIRANVLNPNSKISDEIYNILYKEFNGKYNINKNKKEVNEKVEIDNLLEIGSQIKVDSPIDLDILTE